MMQERFIFLGGHRKCGTTMLLDLFDGHEKCCVYPTDISVLYGYFPRYTLGEYTTKERLERLDIVIFGTLKKFLKRNRLEDTNLSIDVMRADFFANIDHDRLTQIEHIIIQMVASFRKTTKKPVKDFPVVVLKETSLEIYAQELAGYFKGAQFIELIRDPRDNYAALLAGADEHYKMFGESEKQLLASLLHRVGLSVKLSKNNHDALGMDHFLSIRFEDLTEDLKASMDNISKWANLPGSSCFKQPTKLGVPTQGNNYDGEKFTKVSRRNVGRWQERMNPFEAQVIEFHLKDMMENFGYIGKHDGDTCAKSAAEFYKWSNAQYFYKDSFKLL